MDFIDEGSFDNDVKIVKARWTYKKWILELLLRGDAEHLVRNNVYLSGHHGMAE
jgi:hypothetical protein